MKLILFQTFLFLAFILIIIGYNYVKSSVSDILIVVGWTFIFALGIILLTNQLEYKTGSSIGTFNNYIEYNYQVDNINYTDIVLKNSTIKETDDYSYFSFDGNGVSKRVSSSHFWGFLLMLVGLFGEILFWFDVKAYGKDMEEIRNE